MNHNTKKACGIFLLLLPFIASFCIQWFLSDIKTAMKVWTIIAGIVAAITICVYFGDKLLRSKAKTVAVAENGAIDPFTYYLYTTKAEEVAEIETLVAEGMSFGEAISEMVRRHPTAR